MSGLSLRVGLSHKIFGVGAIGVVGLLVVGAIYFVGTRSVEHYQTMADEAGGTGALPNKIMVQLLELRRAEKDFLLRSDNSYAKRHDELSQSIRTNLAAVKQQFSASGHADVLKTVDALGAGFDAYAGHFTALVEGKNKLGLNENSGLEGTLRGSVHAIETTLKEFDSAPASAAMLTMRRHEKDFMLRRDAKYGEAMKKAAAEFAAIVAKSNIPEASKEDIAKKLAAYQRDFFAYMAGMQVVLREQKAMSDAYAKIEPEITALNQAADQVAAQARTAAGMARGETAMRMEIALLVIILAVSALAFFVARGITRPIKGLVEELKKLAVGDFNISLPWLRRKDEIGEIAKALDLLVDKVGSTVADIKFASNEVTSASAEIATATTDLSQRSEEQAASLEQASASMEQMTATVKKNAGSAMQASELASGAREVANRGGTVVSQTIEAMARIEESSRKISDIIGVIDEVARQTNLLALNAAVEAARAGDAGRGFGVVASEVRSLAQRSSQAAKDIKALITGSALQVKEGVDLANYSGSVLKEIVESIHKVSEVVSEIAHASAEQSEGLEQINRALSQMDEITQQNSALVEENAATAKALETQARTMDERAGYFRLRDEAAAGQSEPDADEPAAGSQTIAVTTPARNRGAAPSLAFHAA
jgi:methyl-accepting chemotaxis protein